MNKRYLVVGRRAKACPVRVEILEDRYAPAGFPISTLLPAPDSVTPVQALARPATGPVLDVVSQGAGQVLNRVSQSTGPTLAPVSQGTGSAFELIPAQVGGSLPAGGAALGPGAGVVAWGRDTGGPVTSPGQLAGEHRLMAGPERGTQKENALADVGAASQALSLGLPGPGGVAGTAMRQGSVFAWRDAFSAERETSIEARGETEKTRGGSGVAGEDGVARAAGCASAEAGAEEPAGPATGTREQDRLLPPIAPLSLNDVFGPASGVIDEFLPFDPSAWMQATGQFFAGVADLAKEGSSLAPWLTVLALLGSAYELARRDLRRLQAQQVVDPTQLPDLSGLLPPGEP
jgi:hypothetical protein